MVNAFCQGTIGVDGFFNVFGLFTSEPLLPIVFHILIVAIDGVSNVFLQLNHCHQWFFNGHSLFCILALDD